MVGPTSTIFLPTFGGQGVLNCDSKHFALYTSFPSGAVLYDACYDALQAELGLLPSEVVKRLDICVDDFKKKASIFSPVDEQYLLNPVVSGTTLLLQQTLQYLHFSEKFDSEGDRQPLEQVCYLNAQHAVGILGFSSGILAAAVVAASRTRLGFIKHAVEAYRLAFWIGVRVQLFRSSNQPGQDSSNPWALAIIFNKSDIEQSVLVFNKTSPEARVYITAVIDDNCVTVSGHPDDLATFKTLLPDTAIVCETNIVGLYHVPSRLRTVREEVLADVISRGIQFPTFSELIAPLRCSCTGEILHWSTESLVSRVVDMILMRPVHWDRVIKNTSASIPSDCPVHILNFGGGKGLVKSLTKSLRHHEISKFQCLEVGRERMFHASSRHEPIAIVGMAVNMPGAKTVDELWDILAGGSRTLQPVPSDRFEFSDYTTGQIPGRTMSVDTGNFIKNVGWFDNKFFGLNPREAKSMDPQQRLLLHVAYEALEDAGYVPDSTPTFSRDAFGCYVGAATHDYVHNLRQSIDVYYATGTLGSFLSGRLSYCLGFSGPSMVIDTACSSSMVAIHQASRALLNGDCNAALAGGVNVISSPDIFIGLDRAHFLSSTGCKPFDALADGYSRAEGCGLFVLKRLSDAVAENDRILGVIRGVEVNQSGITHSITHPHGPTQESLLKRVLARSDIDPHLINFVESHGTGTQAGDVNELQSLRRILSADRPSNNPLHIGSIKANIGHLEAASGSASLAKVLLMLRHSVIPAQVSFNTLNPKIPSLHIDNTIIPTENAPWLPAAGYDRRFSLINNFGASGSNAVMIIEEHVATSSKLPPIDVSSYVFALSAKDNTALEKMRTNLIRWLQANEEMSLANLSYTLMARRHTYAYRLVVTAATAEELVSRLGHAVPVRVDQQGPPVVFVFSGQGGQIRGMGSSLYRSSSLFRKYVDECDSILRAQNFGSILPVINGFTVSDSTSDCTKEVYHTAIFSLEYALAMLWESWGIKPTAVVGHSLGEYAALVVAGVYSLNDALNLLANRSSLMSEKCVSNSTGMLAVPLEPAKLRGILESPMGSNLNISCYNSPQDCVISGPIGELATLKEFLETMLGCRCTQLDVPFAFHSPAMGPILCDLSDIGNRVKARPPSIPVLSTVLGRVVMPGDASFCDSDYPAKHCAYPVRFVDAIESYLTYPNLHSTDTTWIEIGPHPSLLPMLKSFPALSKSSIVASLHKKHDNWVALSKALASLCSSHSINWRVLFSQIGHAEVLTLPSYPFSPKKYWIPYNGPAGIEFSVIQSWEQYPSNLNNRTAILEASVSHLMPYMDGHRVGGVPLCPASVFIELVAAGATLALKHLSRYPVESALVFNELTFTKLLTHSRRREDSTLRMSLVTTTGVFSISSCGVSSASCDEVVHTEGQYAFLENAEALYKFKDLIPGIDERMRGVCDSSSDGGGPEKFSTRTIYDILFARVVGYSQEFQTIQSLELSRNGLEAIADVRIDVGFQSGTFVIDILLTDTLLHVPGLVANLQGNQAHAYICSDIGSLIVLPSSINRGYRYTVYCKVSKTSDGVICDSYAFRDEQSRVLVAVAEGIRFKRVNLAGLKLSLANLTKTEVSDLTESGSPVQQTLDDVETRVVDIVARACNLDAKDVSLELELDFLGIHLPFRSGLLRSLTSAFPNIHICLENISKCTNVQAIIQLITGRSITPTSHLLKDQPASLLSSNSADGAKRIKSIFAQVLDMDDDSIDEDVDLGYLGFDSLSCLEVVHLLGAQCGGAHLPSNFINSSTTIRDVQSYLSSSDWHGGSSPLTEISKNVNGKSPGDLDPQQQLWCLRKAGSSRTPLVLVHDGSGLAACYRHISNINRDLYGINNPHFLSSQGWSSVTDLAGTYAGYIQKATSGPVIVGGWSFGGVVAFEMARILGARTSFSVKGVVLIDSPSPVVQGAELNTDIIDCVLNDTKSIDAEFRELCKSQFSMSSKLVSEYKPLPAKDSLIIPVVFLRSTNGFNPPNVAVPTWLAERKDARSVVCGWDALSGSLIHTIDIPGNHFQPFELENVAAVSLAISQACDILDE